MLFPVKFGLFLFLLSGVTACNAQVKNDPSAKVTTAEPTSPLPGQDLKPPKDHDPYFTGSTDVVTETAPQTITRNVLQTKDGKIWLATWHGAVCYDGEIFTNYTNKAGLRRYRVFSLLEDREANLWLGTIGAGVFRYDGDTFTNITTANGLGSNEIECMLEDKSGNLWFGTGAGVTRYDGASFQNFTPADGLPDTDVHSIAQDKTGKIWVASTGGISYLDGQTFIPFYKANGKPFNNVRIILSDNTGALWFGGNDGLVRYDGANFTTLLEDFTGYLFEDSSGDIWISVISNRAPERTGLYRFAANTSPPSFAREKFTQVLKVDDMVFGISEDKAGNIWFGTIKGVCRYDGETFEWFRTAE